MAWEPECADRPDKQRSSGESADRAREHTGDEGACGMPFLTTTTLFQLQQR